MEQRTPKRLRDTRLERSVDKDQETFEDSLNRQVTENSQHDADSRDVDRDVELGQCSLTWIYAISLWLVPILGVYTSQDSLTSPPSVLSTAWVFLECWLGLNTSIRGQIHAAHFQRGILRISAALLLWVLSDLHSPAVLAPWIISKITLGYLIISNLHWQQAHRICVADTLKSKEIGLKRLATALGALCGISMIFFWKSPMIFSLSGSLMLMLNQLAYFAFAFSTWTYISDHESKSRVNISVRVIMMLSIIQLGSSLMVVIAPEVMHENFIPFLSSCVLLIYSAILMGQLVDFAVIERALLTPWRAISISILSLCMLGSVLLMTPMVHLGGEGLTWVEAIFTSVSASCITGLSIIDLSQMSFAGQLVILFLIQIGGFGIILITHMIISLSADRYNFYINNLTHAVSGQEFTLQRHAQELFIFVMAVELISGCALSLFFLEEGHSLSQSLWLGGFTAISAFCNAGFALQSNSFIDYAHHTPILVIISITVIFGGIGPRVVRELIASWRHQRTIQSLSLYTRIILWSNLVLIIIPTCWFLVSEWSNALSHLGSIDKLTNAFFHTTSLRTAGFNSFDLSQLSDSSWSISMILMVIGGSPFSTAGGIKVTTVALAFFALLPILRGEKHSLLLDRAQSLAHGAKALAILLVSLLIVGVAIFILQCLGEPISLKMLLFEVVSALGTVGLSQGGTSMLSVGGLIVIMICMFLGRVGPPALLLSFTSAQMDPQNKRRPDSYVKEDLPLS